MLSVTYGMAAFSSERFGEYSILSAETYRSIEHTKQLKYMYTHKILTLVQY